MLPPDADQKMVDERPDGSAVAVDARDDLGNDGKPGVDADVTEPLEESRLHLRRGTVVEPQREQPQDILQQAPLALLRRRATQGDAPEEAADRGRNVARRRGGLHLCVVLHRRGVEQRPMVPPLRPLSAGVRRRAEGGEHVGERRVCQIIRHPPSPQAQLQERTRHEFGCRDGSRAQRCRCAHRPTVRVPLNTQGRVREECVRVR